jgi:eukaryotic-like serine/threonine-protein kinase
MVHGKHRMIEPRAKTLPTGVRHTTTWGRLPDDLMTEQVQRLGVFAAVAAGLWGYGLVMDTLVAPVALAMPVSKVSVAIELGAILASVLMLVYARYTTHPCELKMDVGLGYMLLNAVGVALLNTTSRVPALEPGGHLSWITIVILVSSMIIPSTPRKTLIVSLVAASMDPLAVWIAHLRGLPVPSFVNTMILYSPNYACALVAVVPSHVLQHIGRRLREAQELGSYKLVEPLGHGGMGEVWRAQHRLLAREAAIKLVRPELLGASNEVEAKMMLRRFEREAQATAALCSPYTIRVFDFGVSGDGTFYYVMELLSGRDLESLIREFGPIPADRTFYLLKQICQSLAEAHARGLVHRDVKPANIYVCRMGLEYDFVKVLDFGLVKFNGKKSMQNTLMTGDHATTGTPAFMAPEIILGEAQVDRRADVYALGCVAYYLLTGELVFEADTPMKMFLQHVQTQPVPPSQRTELPVPRELDDLILACLEKDPDKRPQDAEQVLQMARRCRTCITWDSDAAKNWWEKHLVDLTGPLVEPRADLVERPFIVS